MTGIGPHSEDATLGARGLGTPEPDQLLSDRS